MSGAALLAGLGPFFAVDVHDAGSGSGEDGRWSGDRPAGAGPRSPAARPASAAWRSMGELADGSTVLGARVAAVRGALAAGGGQPPEAVEVRVAASVAHLGLAARVLSPYLALAALHGWAPGPADRLSLAALRWQPVLGGPCPLSLPRPLRAGPVPAPAAGPGSVAPSPSTRDAADLAAALAAHVLGGPVRELSAPFGVFGVSGHILRGNVASALNGAAGMIAGACPEAAAAARALAALLLGRPPLRGASGRTPAGAFRRRSCCLIYRAAPERAGALCGDCVLRRDGR